MTANEVSEFKKILFDKEVKFVYTKVDGSERKARGTMKPGLLPLPKKIEEKPEDEQKADVKAGEKKVIKKRSLPADSVLYYDLDAKGFRSFKIGNLVSFEK
jgi:hypothetical protein